MNKIHAIFFLITVKPSPLPLSRPVRITPMEDVTTPIPWKTLPVEIGPTVSPTYDYAFSGHCEMPLDPKSGLPTVASPGRYQGWNEYQNEKYGFSLALPHGWDLFECRNAVRLSPQTHPEKILIIAFKRPWEQFSIIRSGVGAGAEIQSGKVLFLGEQISKVEIVYQGKMKTLVYIPTEKGTAHSRAEIMVDDLVFTFSLDDLQQDYDLADLDSITIATVDKIIESVALIHANPTESPLTITP